MNIRSIASVLMVGFAACGRDVATGPAATDLRAAVEALGFDPTGMADYGTYILVEGDVRLDKSILSVASAGTRPNLYGAIRPSYQYNATHIVSGSNVSQITVDLSGIEGVSDWAQAARNAIADYNGTNTRIHMSEAMPGDITSRSVAQFDDPGVIAAGDYPAWSNTPGKPGPSVTISTNHNGYSLSQKEYVLVHEFGHTIGLRHDNALAVEGAQDVGAELISGTPSSDPGSVMVRIFTGQSFTGFSSYDLLALNNLYSILHASIETPTVVGSNVNCRFDAIVSGGTQPYTISWDISEPSMGFLPNTGSGATFVTKNYQRVAQTYHVHILVRDATYAMLNVDVYGPVSADGSSYDSVRCWP